MYRNLSGGIGWPVLMFLRSCSRYSAKYQSCPHPGYRNVPFIDNPAGLDLEILSAIAIELRENFLVILEGTDVGASPAIASDLLGGCDLGLRPGGIRSVTIS